MRKSLAGALAFLIIGSSIGSGVANAHQPLVLLDTDTSAAKGPLIVDGTLSFAVRAAFTKAGQKKAFRAQFKEGEELTVQYLIVDKKPESALRKKSLPKLVITSPTGSKVRMKFTERTKFFEPYSGVNYLYLGRYNSEAQGGIYSFEITSKSRAAITIGVGEKEGVVGVVIRGNNEAPNQLQLQLQHQNQLQLQHQLQWQNRVVTPWGKFGPITARLAAGQLSMEMFMI